MSDDAVRERTSLFARAYSVGSLLAGEEVGDIRKIEKSLGGNKKDFNDACEKYYETHQRRMRNRDVLLMFEEGRSNAEIEKAVGALEAETGMDKPSGSR